MKIGVGDTVRLRKVTNASLNLWQKAKSRGMSYLKCPCNVKATDTCKVIASFGPTGIICECKNFKTIMHKNDAILIA